MSAVENFLIECFSATSLQQHSSVFTVGMFFFKNMHCRGSNEDKVDVQMKTFSWHSNLIIVTSLVEVLCYLLLHFTQMAVKNKSIS